MRQPHVIMMAKGWKVCHIRTEGEGTVTNLERRRVRALIPPYIKALDNSSSLDSRIGGSERADEIQNKQ